MRKITINLPADLIDSAVALHGKGLTETVRDALESQRKANVWDQLRAVKGQVDFGASWQELVGKYDEDK